MEFKLWLETNYSDLYHSTELAFPDTSKRQHISNSVVISSITKIPFIGLGTLFVKGITENNYKPIILIKNVNYNNGKINEISIDQDILVRCNCNDFYYRFNYFDYQNKLLYGRVRKKYEAKYNPGSANPFEKPGMCKHIIKLMEELISQKVIT